MFWAYELALGDVLRLNATGKTLLERGLALGSPL